VNSSLELGPEQMDAQGNEVEGTVEPPL
jgi:hypothetical protein